MPFTAWRYVLLASSLRTAAYHVDIVLGYRGTEAVWNGAVERR